MNYRKVYSQIVDRAKSRTTEGYSERHHIIPKCLGGDDSPTNIVRLTAREHFICHWLLAREYNIQPLWFAFNMMCNAKNRRHRRYEPSSRAYSEAREGLSLSRKGSSSGMKGRTHSEETRNKISQANRGRKKTCLEIDNMSKRLKGVKKSEEHRRKISEAKKGDNNPAKRPEVANKISLSKKGKGSNRKGVKLSEETRRRISEVQKGIKKPQVVVKCKFCDKTGGRSAITRWHDENCKHK